MSKIKNPSPSGERQPYQAIARQEHRRASPVFPVFVPTFALRSTHRPVLDLALVEAAGRGLNPDCFKPSMETHQERRCAASRTTAPANRGVTTRGRRCAQSVAPARNRHPRLSRTTDVVEENSAGYAHSGPGGLVR